LRSLPPIYVSSISTKTLNAFFKSPYFMVPPFTPMELTSLGLKERDPGTPIPRPEARSEADLTFPGIHLAELRKSVAGCPERLWGAYLLLTFGYAYGGAPVPERGILWPHPQRGYSLTIRRIKPARLLSGAALPEENRYAETPAGRRF
jgi:hypothetical protein